MQCRYCGKELALFKRLTKGGEFCSEAHKQRYQEEYNRLALTRLLQAQKKGLAEPSGPHVGPPPAAPVAVEEPAVAEPVLEEPAVNVPVMELAPLEISDLDASIAEEEAARDVPAEAHAESEAGPEAEPLEIADFLTESPAMAAWPEETPHLEPWLDFSSGPAV